MCFKKITLCNTKNELEFSTKVGRSVKELLQLVQKNYVGSLNLMEEMGKFQRCPGDTERSVGNEKGV